MKRSVLCLILCGVSFIMSAQKEGDHLESAQPLIIEVDKRQEPIVKKFKKFNVYFGRLNSSYSAESVEIWSILNISPVFGNEYFTYQNKERYDVEIKNNGHITFGMNRNIKLKDKLSLSYGIGLEIFSLGYSYEVSILEKRTINHYEIIKKSTFTQGEHVRTAINHKIDSDILFLSNDIESQINYRSLAINLPFSMQYEVFRNLYVSTNFNTILPIRTTSSGSYYDVNEERPIFTITDNDQTFNRIFFTLGMGAQFQFMNKYIMGLHYRKTITPLFSPVFRGSSQEVYKPSPDVHFSSFEARLGYAF